VSNGITNQYRGPPCRTQYLVMCSNLVRDVVRAVEITPRVATRQKDSNPPRHRRSTYDHMRSECNAPQAQADRYGGRGAEGRAISRVISGAGERVNATTAIGHWPPLQESAYSNRLKSPGGARTWASRGSGFGRFSAPKTARIRARRPTRTPCMLRVAVKLAVRARQTDYPMVQAPLRDR
jgi:hypothetical protein